MRSKPRATKSHDVVMNETGGGFSLTCRPFFLAVLFACGYPLWALAELDDIPHIPHVVEKAEVSFEFDYLYAPTHRAFVIAPGGAWAWQVGKQTTDIAKKAALEKCKQDTRQKCVLFAVDDDIVFDEKAWSELWGPYLKYDQAQKLIIGTNPGQKFPDLKFTNPAGLNKTISQLKGKVVFIHFWGCWCPSCGREFASLIEMYRILKKDVMGKDVEFVLLQLREPISQARYWAKENNFSELPLSDSGVQDNLDTVLTLQNGKKVQDSDFAKVYPTSYVIDKHGIVLFTHMGAVSDWTEYVPFIRDAVARSGK